MESPSISADHVGAVAETIEVTSTNTAFRDINIYQSAKPHFSSINLSSYSLDKYISPKFTTLAIKQLVAHRMLIVSGGIGFDKGSFIRHLAYLIFEEHQNLRVEELLRNDEDVSLVKTLHESEVPHIFIIDQVHPRFFDHDVRKLVESINNQGHFVVLTTETPREAWGLSEPMRDRYWFEVPHNDRYSREVLAKFFIERFTMFAREIPISISLPLKMEATLFEGLTVEEVVSRFESPDQIAFFIQVLSDKEELSGEEFEEIIQTSVNDEESLICRWYRNLDSREQLIGLGMALLEGLYDDQFFICMHEIVKNFWQYRDPFLLSLDYCDLDFLLPFFVMEDINEEKRLVRNRYSNQRTDIVSTAWPSYRRHIISALPLITKMAEETILSNELNWEKYGTRDRRMILRQAIGNTISDIGLVSYHAVESILLELASFSETTIQRIPAKAMARWREFGQEELLFKTLSDWQRDERILKLIESFLRNDKIIAKRQSQSSKALSYIKATALLTLRYAASYDRPNHLDQRIIDLLKEIALDNGSLVQTRLKETLPRIIHHHSLQLIEILDDFMIIDDIREPISEGLAMAYEDYPHELKRALFSWLEENEGEVSLENRRRKFTNRDKVVATILETFGKIHFTGENDVMSVDEVFERIVELRKNEGRLGLQEVIIEVAAKLISEHFGTGAPYLTELYDIDREDDKKILLRQLLHVYIKQRCQHLSEHSINVKGIEIPAWLEDKERPFTPVEELMLNWVDDKDVRLKKLGTSAFLRFIHNLDFYEQIELSELRWNLSRLEDQKKSGSTESSPASSNDFHGDGFTSYQSALSFYKIFSLWPRIHIFFFLIGKDRTQRELFKELYKSIYFHRNYRRDYKRDLLRRWKHSTSPVTQMLAQWFQRFLK